MPAEENGGLGEDSEDGIYLFSNSTKPLSAKDLLIREAEINQNSMNKKRPRFKRRKIDDTDSEDESAKLESVAVSYDWVIGSKY